ncbi:MAG TPA: endonuclease domain-containing protein [Bacteroidales bacterium]|nr:endonuclease domain-containing protein [Bacteroidales bacterium]
MFYGADSTTLRAAAILRRNMTLSEFLLWKKLKDRKIFNTKFRRQHPVDIFIVDFYCHEYKLVIEIDGEIHNNKEVHEYDLNRSAELNKFGIRVIRFSNDQIIYKIDQVLTAINEVISELTPL